MKALTFARRCSREILRDPLNLMFGLGFPLALMGLLSAISANVPADLFAIEHLAPGLAVFGFSFITLFAATLVARDRESALLQRLYTSPLTPKDFILGYTLPLVPMALAQCIVCYLAAFALGMAPSWKILPALAAGIPVSIFHIGLGLLCGSLLNTKQVGGVCGALLTNLSAWLSGVWFDLELVGGGFQKVAQVLPFFHAVELERAIIRGELTIQVGVDLLFVVGYAAATLLAAVLVFLWQMRRQ